MSRITSGMLTNSYLSDLQTNLNSMSKYQDQLSSGQKIKRASDDPTVATQTMKLNSELEESKQFSSNITGATSWLDTTDTALSQAGDVMQRLRELLVKAGNATYAPSEIQSIKDEAVTTVQELGQILNSSYDGSYVFSGTKSTSPAVVVDNTGAMSYADNNGNSIADVTAAPGLTYYNQLKTDLKVEISTGVKVKYNETAPSLLEFNDATGTPVNTINVLKNIISNLTTAADPTQAGTPTHNALISLNTTGLPQLDAVIDNLLSSRARVGATEDRMQSAATVNSNQTDNMTSILSSVEDVDYSKAAINFSSAQAVYQAALQVNAKVIQKTLLDYL